jgi:hypothetical protein
MRRSLPSEMTVNLVGVPTWVRNDRRLATYSGRSFSEEKENSRRSTGGPTSIPSATSLGSRLA